ncbi:cupin domain-containing protein, partial [Patulibacter sp. S7RM1-6]
ALLPADATGLGARLLRIPPGGSASPGAAGEGWTVLVGDGVVQVVLEHSRPVLRAGDALRVRSGELRSCWNLGDAEALVFCLAAPRPA